MKKILLPLLMLGFAFSAFAQNEETLPAAAPKKRIHLVKLVPQEFIVNTFKVDWEIKTGNRTSLQISPSFTSAENSTDYKNIKGGGADLTAKFYLRSEGEELRGFYGGLNGSFHKFRIKDGYTLYSHSGNLLADQNHTVTRLGGNLVLGYQFIFENVVALDLYAGGGIRASRIKEDVDPYFIFSFPDPRYQGIAPKVGFSVGIML